LALPEREVRPVVAQVVAAGAAGVFALTRPGTPLGPSSSELGRILVERHFGSAQGLVGLAWAMLFALGVFPLLLVALPRVVKGRGTRALVDVLVVVAAVHLLQSLVGATDTSRPAAAALPELAAVAIAVAVAARSALGLAAVIAASLVVWQPFLVLHGSPGQYFHYCCPQFFRQAGNRTVSTAFALLVVAAVTVTVALVLARRRRAFTP